MIGSRDAKIVFLARFIRMFSYGALTVVLFLYLAEIGLSNAQIGVLLSLISAGDLVITLYLSTSADTKHGRKNTLICGALLKVFAGLGLAFFDSFAALVVFGIIGVLSVNGGEVGPFVAVEQAAIVDSCSRMIEESSNKADTEGDRVRLLKPISIASVTAWYQLVGKIGLSVGALVSGLVVHYLQSELHWTSLHAERAIVVGYGAVGVLMALLYLTLSRKVECVPESSPDSKLQAVAFAASVSFGDRLAKRLGLKSAKSLKVVGKLSGLFMIDAFAGGFVMQSFLVFWFHQRWQLDVAWLGALLTVVNIIAALSGLLAGVLVDKFGAMNTMVFTHLPSNLFLIAIPLMPSAILSLSALLCRCAISEMDVPARQAYVMLVVQSDEKSAANGITSVVRSLGLTLSPLFLGLLMAGAPNSTQFAAPFYIGGGLKIVYDLLVYCAFQATARLGSRESPGE